MIFLCVTEAQPFEYGRIRKTFISQKTPIHFKKIKARRSSQGKNLDAILWQKVKQRKGFLLNLETCAEWDGPDLVFDQPNIWMLVTRPLVSTQHLPAVASNKNVTLNINWISSISVNGQNSLNQWVIVSVYCHWLTLAFLIFLKIGMTKRMIKWVPCNWFSIFYKMLLFPDAFASNRFLHVECIHY